MCRDGSEVTWWPLFQRAVSAASGGWGHARLSFFGFFFFFFCPRLLKGYGVFKLFFTFVHLHWWDVTVYGKFSFTSTGMAAISFGHLQRTWGLEKLLHCFQELSAPAFS
jgi:hypothetical protein